MQHWGRGCRGFHYPVNLSCECLLENETDFFPRIYVSVNSKTAHPPPPGKPRGIWLFWKNIGQIPRYVASLDGQMPHPLELQRGSNPPPSRHVKATVETSSAKFSATTNFLFSLSSLHTLSKGIFHDISIKNDNNRKTHVESTRAMTRERGSRAESKNCEILLLPLTDVLTRKSNVPPGGPHFGSNSPLYGA